jgi:signal transduction histidine kinase/RimJ/RimL family protein N-acetyltransferase
VTAPGARPPAPPRLPPEPPLSDEAIQLRLPRPGDAEAIAAACSDPEIARWIPVPVPYTLHDAVAFVDGVALGWATGSELTFAIDERGTGALAGMIGLHAGRVAGRASVGYWLAPGARGRGHATRAVRLLATWAFADPTLERLELTTLVGNDASGRVALRAGFRREGILRRYLSFRDTLVDAVMYAMVREDTEGEGESGVADDPLASVSLFADLGPRELARVRAVATEVSLAPGGILITEGDPGDALFVLLEGTLAVSRRAGSGEVSLTTVGPGAVQGEIAVLEGGRRRATVRAATPARLVRIGRDDLFDVLAREPAVLRSLVGTVARRLRDLESSAQEQERLASLGTLAAGLAHELNNPAAAARSSVGQLDAALDEWDRATTALGTLTAGRGPAAGPVAAELLDTLREETARRAGDPPTLDPLDAADRRDAVGTLLGGLGMAAPHEPAAALVALGWDGNELDDLLAPFGDDEARLVVAAWVAATALVRQLLAEVAIATERISEIIGAVREYTYLDRAPVQRVAVTAGIENTLVILRSRWKAGVAIQRSYAPDLPSIDAYGSELNQVWTNLIANAIDAMGGTGELTISAIPAPAGDGVTVEIRDSGPGIPEDVQGRIFDPFFTTKDLGAGTGLGLHISRSIVERHGGHLELASGDPGRTTFRVTLPAHLPPATPAAESPPAGSLAPAGR